MENKTEKQTEKCCRQNVSFPGSVTVEAVLIFPVVLFSVFAMLYFCFYVHGRAYLTMAAEEAALCGSMEAVRREGEPEQAAAQRSSELASAGFFLGDGPLIQCTAGEEIRVDFEMKMNPVYVNTGWLVHASGRSLALHPAETIRHLRSHDLLPLREREL